MISDHRLAIRANASIEGPRMFPVTSARIVYRACEKWSENGDSRHGAALAYYTLFSISPLLLIAIYIAGAVFGEDAARGKVHEQLDAIMGEQIALTVEKMVENARPKETDWTLSISIGLLLIAALGAFLHVRTTLCMIWRLVPPQGSTWVGFLMDYVLALAMVLIITVLLLISLACGLAIPVLQKTAKVHGLDVESYWQWVEVGSSFLFLMILFALVYRILSGGRVPWAYVWYGAVITSILFTIGKTVLGYYIVYSGTTSMYGAAGSLVAFLVWVYYSAQIFFFGAELIQARWTRHEWMNGQAPA